MTPDDWVGGRLRDAAAPVAPLDGARASRLLANALQATRARRRASRYLGRASRYLAWWDPWTRRIALVAVGGVLFALLASPRPLPEPALVAVSVRESPAQHIIAYSRKTESGTEAPTAVREKVAVREGFRVGRLPATWVASVPRHRHRPRRRAFPSGRVRELDLAIRGRVPAAANDAPREPWEYVADGHGASPVHPRRATSVTSGGESDRGSLSVAVTHEGAPPPNADEGLRVQVVRDVPAGTPGSAEVTGLQTVRSAPGSAGESPVPVWAHARIQSGAEPVMTLTASR